MRKSTMKPSVIFFMLSLLVLQARCAGEEGGTSPEDARAEDTDAWEPPQDGIEAESPGDAAPDADDPVADEAVELPCDEGFYFEPADPETGLILWIHYTHPTVGYVYVGFEVTGDGTVELGGTEVVGGGDVYHWRVPAAIHAGGLYTATFTADSGELVVASCSFLVRDTGPPPDLPDQGTCESRVCGERDDAGNLCTDCPVVGTCLDPPSPIHPGGPDAGTWSCLDSAGCLEDDGLCRMWCPGEPCDTERHPDGCPQGVEACYVDAHIADYEEACRTCCESRRHDPTGEYACWDETYSMCRYPGDCGLPYPVP